MLKVRILATFILILPTIAQCGPAGPVWSIELFGLEKENLGNITLELTEENADTCMSGNWKKARLVQSSFQPVTKQRESDSYFPTYEVTGQIITIQLNPPGRCDAYLMVSGRFSSNDGKGDYRLVGLGISKPLGTFTAKRQ